MGGQLRTPDLCPRLLAQVWRDVEKIPPDRLMAHVYLSGWDGSVAVMRPTAHRRP